MSLELDTHQRAMLQEMGITVWLPKSDASEPVEVKKVQTEVSEKLKNTHSADLNAINNIAYKEINKQNTAINNIKKAAEKASNEAVVNERAPLPTGLEGMDWMTLQQAAQSCQACHLCSSRKQVVFGAAASLVAGENKTHWLVVGDPPTEADELAGAPFTDESAALLTKMLKAIQLDISTQVTLTNAAKCRSSGLSTGVAELAQCAHFLRRQIALTQPQMILAMGRYAAQALLQQTAPEPLGKLRGVVHRVTVGGQVYPVVVTYTPQLLLKTPSDKAKAWADLQLAKEAVQAAV